MRTNKENKMRACRNMQLPMEWLMLCVLMITGFSLWIWTVYNKMQGDPNSDAPLPPGSFGIPLLGETISLLTKGSSFYDGKLKQHGKIYKTHLFGSPTIRIVGEENVHCILSSENDFVTSHWPKSTQLLLSGGLVLETSGPSHLVLKKTVLKAFTHRALDRYIPTFTKTCQAYIDIWCQRGRLCFYPEVRRLMFDVASKTLAGFNLTKDEVSSSMALFQDFVNGMLSLPFNLPGFSFRKAMTARNILLDKIDDCLSGSMDPLDGGSPNILTFLRPVFESESLDSSRLKNICLDLLFASHETTSSAACFLILYLSKHDDVFLKLDQELRENGIFVKADQCKITLESINSLVLLRNVVREAIRLCCPIGAGFRKVIKSFVLGGYQIPKGWFLAYSIRESHETSEYFSSPKEFDPDRWNHTDDNSRHFLCFGGGKRRCIGKEFSMLLLKILTIEMMRMCVWKMEDLDPEIIYFPSPHPRGGMTVSIKRK